MSKSKCNTLDEIMNDFDNETKLEYESDKKLIKLFESKGINNPFVDNLKWKCSYYEKTYRDIE